MKTIFLTAVLFVAALTAKAQLVSQYDHRTDTLHYATTSWTTLNYGKTHLKNIEVILDSMETGQILWIVEGTDTAMAKRHRIPKTTKDGDVSFSSYQFFTSEDTLRFRVNLGEMQAIVMKKPYFGIR
jgi:hypothetical protein